MSPSFAGALSALLSASVYGAIYFWSVRVCRGAPLPFLILLSSLTGFGFAAYIQSWSVELFLRSQRPDYKTLPITNRLAKRVAQLRQAFLFLGPPLLLTMVYFWSIVPWWERLTFCVVAWIGIKATFLVILFLIEERHVAKTRVFL